MVPHVPSSLLGCCCEVRVLVRSMLPPFLLRFPSCSALHSFPSPPAPHAPFPPLKPPFPLVTVPLPPIHLPAHGLSLPLRGHGAWVDAPAILFRFPSLFRPACIICVSLRKGENKPGGVTCEHPRYSPSSPPPVFLPASWCCVPRHWVVSSPGLICRLSFGVAVASLLCWQGHQLRW